MEDDGAVVKRQDARTGEAPGRQDDIGPRR
jgi:hypothetical protein